MCENLAYDPEPGDIEVLYVHLYLTIFFKYAKCIICLFTACYTFV
jgi:hypothetical protein